MESSTHLTKKIRKANLILDPLCLAQNFVKFSSNGIEVKLESKKRAQLDEETCKWCFSLLEKNMRKIYEASKHGWNESEKKLEMFDPKAYYLIAFDANNTNKPIGFCHFRFDMDFDDEVIYCYELQIEPENRNIGLGKFMMEFLETLCVKLKLDKVMLTCSKHNQIGQKFFKNKINYVRDETDLNDEDPTVDYEILSKDNSKCKKFN